MLKKEDRTVFDTNTGFEFIGPKKKAFLLFVILSLMIQSLLLTPLFSLVLNMD